MRYLVVDPTTKSRACFFTVYGEDRSFLYRQILNSDRPEISKLADGNYMFICFDAFKTMGKFDQKFGFMYDVETLYRLAGYEFRDLIHLGEQVFGDARLYHYRDLSSRIGAHLKSFREVSIDTSNYTEAQLIPAELIEKFYGERASVIFDLFLEMKDQDVIDFYKKEMFKNLVTLNAISQKPLNIDISAVDGLNTHHIGPIKNRTVDGKLHLKFNPVGAKTGRLGFKRGTVNVYGMQKAVRKCIVAEPDTQIYQFDFKSFQPRLAIFSTDDEKFKDRFRNIEDIYSLFPGERNTIKISFIAWMFSNMKNELFGQEAKPIQDLRNKLFREVQKNGRLINRFGRVLHFKEEKINAVFQNYITSLEVDAILILTRLINKVFQKRKSRILFPFHDAIVLQVHDEEKEIVKNVKNFMESLHRGSFGTSFPVDVKGGHNLGELSDV